MLSVGLKFGPDFGVPRLRLDGFIDFDPLLAAGVYALTWQGKVVYVGQSRNLLKRLRDHQNNATRNRRLMKWEPKSNKMLFDGIKLKPCIIEDLDRIEREMIRRFHPKYNVHHKPLVRAPMLAPIDVDWGDFAFTLNPPPKVLGLVRRA